MLKTDKGGRRISAALVLSAVLLSGGMASAQDASKRPPRATEATEALQRAHWQKLDEGLRFIKTSTALGTDITALEIAADNYRLDVLVSTKPDGQTAKSALKESSAVLAVNGSFFRVREGKLFAVGLIRDGGTKFGNAWQYDGGYLLAGETPSIVSSRSGEPRGEDEFLQSKPVLIEPGGNWAMNTNQGNLENRTAVCLKPGGDIIIMTVAGGGLSLFETGWLFRSRDWGGFFECDSAIALDGGGSTQLSVKDHPELAVSGETKVHNFLAVVAR